MIASKSLVADRLRKVVSNRASAFILLGLIWATVRIFPVSQFVPWTSWEVWEARKLLEYGFLERYGAIINIHFMAGRLAHPELFNYVNHPLPPLWGGAAIYAGLGGWGVIWANVLLGAVSTLLTLFVLRRNFTPVAAWFGALLAAVAPTSIIFDCETHTVAVAACFWPFLLLARQVCAEDSRRRFAWVLGVLMFMAVQTSWFALVMVLSLLLWVREGEGWGFREHLSLSRGQIAIAVGAALATAVFVVQILVYSPSLEGVRAYAAGQCGLDPGEISRLGMFKGIALRTALMLGPSLLLGTGTGLVLGRRGFLGGRSVLGPIVFFGTWVLAGVFLTRFFYRERSMYEYLVFPSAFLAAGAWQEYRGRWLRPLLLTLGLAGALYPQLQSTIPRVSESARSLGQYLGARVRAEEVVVTDLVNRKFPFEAWDVGGLYIASLAADRIVREGVASIPGLARALAPFGSQCPDIVFLHGGSRPLPPELLAGLRRFSTEVQSASIEIHPQPAGLAARLRYLLWKEHGQFRLSTEDEGRSEGAQLQLELYRLPKERLVQWLTREP